jgi:hypothetical protein
MKIFSCNIGIPRRPWWSNINSKGLHSGDGIEMGETQKSDKEDGRKKNQTVGERVKSFSSKATRLDALERPILLSLRALFLLRKPKSYS